ncbi:hypothetical protein NG796_22085 [Laspinema sp. A4]|uniref:hypothetical protein n=1 Tax=Laspinema sp. D2d TaxID=2953686 RepID=UPI0021BB84E4|nr:hypothetical protein [Laspinema sp. D2d]MCT7985972.1 hypothetical protein [Laspinema sp. D2d]
MPLLEMSNQLEGTILDATALIDFVYLGDWEWLKKQYGPLYIAQELLDSDNLEVETREMAVKHLTPICLETEAMFKSFLNFSLEAPLLSIADRSTLALAQHRVLLCASDDGLMVETCKKHNIPYTRTLRLLTEMVKNNYKTVTQVKEYVKMLIEKRGKHISPKVLNTWYQDLGKI